MNRVWIACLALGLTLPAVTGRAQFFSDDVIEKGTWFLGADLNLSYTSGGDEESASYYMWPRGGYFFAKNWALVPQFIVGREVLDQEAERIKRTDFVAGIAARRYVAFSKKLFVHVLMAYNYQTANFDVSLRQTGELISNSYFIRHQLFSNLVVMYFITPNFAIESAFANFTFSIDSFLNDSRGSSVFVQANFLPQRAAENFSFLALSYHFGR